MAKVCLLSDQSLAVTVSQYIAASPRPLPTAIIDLLRDLVTMQLFSRRVWRALVPACSIGVTPVRARHVLITSTVSLNHFRLLRVVGRGAFGKVRIVERKDTGLSFALKYIRKDEGAPFAPHHRPPPDTCSGDESESC